jgi:hypothetical protein
MVARLVAASNGEPDAVEIVRPSLEDVYLRLVEAASVIEPVEQSARFDKLRERGTADKESAR